MRLAGRIRGLMGSVPRRLITREAKKSLRKTKDCRKVQHKLLDELLAMHRGSNFARDYKLDGMTTAQAFRSQFPKTNFESYRPYIEELKKGNLSAMLGASSKLLMFSLSSGTTGDSKYIPITDRFLKDYRRGWRGWGVRVMNDHKRLRSRSIVQLTSDYDKCRTEGGTPCGNISGLVANMQLKIVRSMYTIPPIVSKIDTPDNKTYTALKLSLTDPDVAMLTTANPSTLIHWSRFADEHCEELIRDIYQGTLSVEIPSAVAEKLPRKFFKRQRRRARRLEKVVEKYGGLVPKKCWPELGMLAVWTGGSAGAFLPKVREIYGDVPVRDHGLSASEGRMTVPIEDGMSSGVLDIESHYFEFIPVEEYDSTDPTMLEAHELEVDRDYFILLTTPSGFYRYDICDVVRCTGFYGTTPMLKFLHKGAHISNVTGEKITEHQAVEAIDNAKQKLNLSFEYFTLAPAWSDPPFYHIISEGLNGAGTATPDELAKRFAEEVDSELKSLNCEYKEKRETGRLKNVRWQHVPHEVWEEFSFSRQRNLGGSLEQYKHPCLSPNLSFLDNLLKTAAHLNVDERNQERLEASQRFAS